MKCLTGVSVAIMPNLTFYMNEWYYIKEWIELLKNRGKKHELQEIYNLTYRPFKWCPCS